MSAGDDIVAELHAEADLWDRLLATPWTLAVVESAADADALAGIGVAAVALSNPGWPAIVREHREVLVVGSALRLRRDVLRAGPARVYGRPLMPRHASVASELRERWRCTPDATAEELRAIWGALNGDSRVVAYSNEVVL